MSEQIEVEDQNGARVTIPLARYNRYASLRSTFRPVAETKAAPAVNEAAHGRQEEGH